jgi:hypothetical protein
VGRRTSADAVVLSAWTPVSPAELWRLLADARGYRDWVCGTRSIVGADGDWPADGTRLWCRFGLPFLAVRGCTTVRSCRPGHSLVLAADVRPLAAVRVTIDVRPRPTGVVVELRETVVGGLARLAPRTTRRIQLWRNRRSLARLTLLCEGRSAGARTSSLQGSARRRAVARRQRRVSSA